MRSAKISLFASFFLLLFFSSCRYSENYEVYALKFCSGWRIGAADLVVGTSDSDSLDVCNMFWLLRSREGHNILVDAGFIDTVRLNKNYIRPDSILMTMKISPGDISDIILTHPHYDHINGITLFPGATVWMQKEDYDYFTGPAWLEGGSARGFSRQDVENLEEVRRSGRLKLINGDDIEIMPGIRVYTGSKHTFQNQYLLVNAAASRNRILLASDAIWFYLNFERMLPASLCFDPEAYVNAMKRMRTLVKDPDLIIPGHDDRVFSKFPEHGKWIVRIGQ